MDKEMFCEWRVIPSCPDYIVSEYGNVKRKDNNYPIKSRIRKGYVVVRLVINGKGRTQFVHRLVAEVFIGPKPKGFDSHHKNHNQTDNHYSNLEYLSTYDHFNEHREVRQKHCVKLTPEQVIEIRAKYQTGDYTLKQLALLFNVSYVEIHKIVKRKVWKHI